MAGLRLVFTVCVAYYMRSRTDFCSARTRRARDAGAGRGLNVCGSSTGALPVSYLATVQRRALHLMNDQVVVGHEVTHKHVELFDTSRPHTTHGVLHAFDQRAHEELFFPP